MTDDTAQAPDRAASSGTRASRDADPGGEPLHRETVLWTQPACGPGEVAEALAHAQRGAEDMVRRPRLGAGPHPARRRRRDGARASPPSRAPCRWRSAAHLPGGRRGRRGHRAVRVVRGRGRAAVRRHHRLAAGRAAGDGRTSPWASSRPSPRGTSRSTCRSARSHPRSLPAARSSCVPPNRCR